MYTNKTKEKKQFIVTVTCKLFLSDPYLSFFLSRQVSEQKKQNTKRKRTRARDSNSVSRYNNK